MKINILPSLLRLRVTTATAQHRRDLMTYADMPENNLLVKDISENPVEMSDEKVDKSTTYADQPIEPNLNTQTSKSLTSIFPFPSVVQHVANAKLGSITFAHMPKQSDF
jgi:hypothetical protein